MSGLSGRGAPRAIVGLIPAGGVGARIQPLPCSKEIYPIGRAPGADGGPCPRAVCSYLLESLHAAGIGRAYMVLRAGKWDVPQHLGSGAAFGIDLAYLLLDRSAGVPYTLDRAYPFVRDDMVALGFPDIVFAPSDVFAKLIAAQSETGADVVLGLFPGDRPDKADMVELDDAGHVRRIVIKQADCGLSTTWGVALWTPAFTEFMHGFLAARGADAHAAPELFVGDVIMAAVDRGMEVRGVPVSDRPFIDIGTPEDLQRAMQWGG